MKKTKSILLIVLHFIILKSSAQTMDVNFTGNTGTCFSYVGLSESQTLAQSFTAGMSGNLTSVKAGLSIDACTQTSSMNCVAKIYSGTCNGTLLATENFSISTGAALSMYEITFSSPAVIVAGQEYTLELSVPSGQICNNDPMWGLEPVFGRWHLESTFDCGGQYAGGTAFLPGCSPYTADYYIQTFVDQCGTFTDVNFTGISGNCYSYTGLNETQTLAQSFTAGITGNMISVKAGLSTDACTETNVMNCIAKIYSGTCAGTLLTTENFTISTGAQLSMYEITLSSPVAVIAGQVYTLELSVPSGQICNNDPMWGVEPVFGRWHLENEYNCGGQYAGGTSFDPGCVPYPGDYYIQTVVSTTANGTDTRTECSPYTWIDGNVYTSDNNTSTFLIVGGAANGCDSLVTLNLTINNVSNGIDVRTECSPFTWIDGNVYTSDNNTSTFLIVGGAANGCDSLVTLNLTVNNVSDVTTSVDGITITANNTLATYRWLDCDNNFSVISGETNSSYTPTINGNYAVELSENGCVDTSACITIASVGIVENTFGNNLLVFPNPTNGNFSVDLGNVCNSVKITVKDINGRLVKLIEFKDSQILNLNLTEPAGMYMLTIESDKDIAVIRLIKQ